MNPEISEFSYGFALTAELIDTCDLKAAGAPEFETQYAEGQTGGGWDVKLPAVPIFLQFKRSYRMVRRYAQEADLFSGLPFFRMYLHRRDQSNQHQLLIDLEDVGHLVLYAAPGFSLSTELSDAYSSDEVASLSLLLRPSEIQPLPDDQQHWVAFQMSPERTYFCSKPRRIKPEKPQRLLNPDSLRALAIGSDRVLDDTFFSRLIHEMLHVYGNQRGVEPERIAKIRRLEQRRRPDQFAQLLSQTLFDCELVVYVSNNQDEQN